MGFRFRRSVRLAPGLRFNLSKGGVSTSIGGRGFTENFSRRGRRTTVGLPGTGLSYSWRSKGRRHGGSIVGLLVLAFLVLVAWHALTGH